MNGQEGLYGSVKIVVLDVFTMKVHMQRFPFCVAKLWSFSHYQSINFQSISPWSLN